MASIIYNSWFMDNATGAINVNADTYYMLLVTSSYTPSKNHSRRSHITNEVIGSGYTAGGSILDVTAALVGSDRFDLTLGVAFWPLSSIIAAGGVVYKHRGGLASADNLLCYLDFGGTIVSTGGTFQVAPSSPIRIQN